LHAVARDANRHDDAVHHSQLADGSRAAARAHQNLANHHRSLAESVMTKSSYSEGYMSGALNDAIAGVERLLADLSKAVIDSPSLEGIKPHSLVEEAHGKAVQNDATSIEHIAAAVRARADANEKKADGDAGDAGNAHHELPEAEAHENAAAGHARLASDYRDLLENARSVMKESPGAAHGSNEDSIVSATGNSSGQIGPGGMGTGKVLLKVYQEQVEKLPAVISEFRKHADAYAKLVHQIGRGRLFF
jgi:hypothetical protein